jgi:hypothetical protein|tara:strand:- start:81 stop:395 length:315 start_codon:yes stop_codon:yes gene_type:complete
MNVEKLEKLLAMTASSEVEEARTAAFLFCKMLREGNADLYRLVSKGVISVDACVRKQAEERDRFYESIKKKQREEDARERRKARERRANQKAKAQTWSDWSKCW